MYNRGTPSILVRVASPRRLFATNSGIDVSAISDSAVKKKLAVQTKFLSRKAAATKRASKENPYRLTHRCDIISHAFRRRNSWTVCLQRRNTLLPRRDLRPLPSPPPWRPLYSYWPDFRTYQCRLRAKTIMHLSSVRSRIRVHVVVSEWQTRIAWENTTVRAIRGRAQISGVSRRRCRLERAPGVEGFITRKWRHKGSAAINTWLPSVTDWRRNTD